MVYDNQDLQREVAHRLRAAIHERSFDMLDPIPVQIEHMLGMTPLGSVVPQSARDDTILDPQHWFWKSYHTDGLDSEEVEHLITDAITRLEERGILQIEEDETADNYYNVRVDMYPENLTNKETTTCIACGGVAGVSHNIEGTSQYTSVYKIDCFDCEESGVYNTMLVRR